MDTSEDGELVGLRYHDGQLLGVQLLSGHRTLLTLTSVDGDETRLELREIYRLVISEFREGNTIDAIYIWDAATLPEDALERFSEVAMIPRRELKEAMSRNEYKVFYLECSYGAEIFAAMKDCRLVSNSNPA